ncbi:serine O-acetyltransferase EpsC [Elizabethkingia sp. JS20170427COW]|uniref:serine O-acetyltransferase EpsC n=1 Tax=Elizabethkingia sp. JS20170427COW TaxID=2583851 RepID=UPI001110D57E|nr:serine O-acetyltransferase EpsC [Elizabethkingia sp. JS20170427COW]QCX53566.1 serine acetyltransferase [Elizabethkingia sp. JS20170427COW]
MNATEDLINTIYTEDRFNVLDFSCKKVSKRFIEKLYQTLFLVHSNYETKDSLRRKFKVLERDLDRLITNVSENTEDALQQRQAFFQALPAIYEALLLDAESILNFDPATESLEEILLAYPGFFATYVYRIAHQLWLQRLKILPRLFTEYAHTKTGIDIHPGAQIGKSFFIDHGTGIVIGETTIIGDEVKIYQGVTLGALSVSKDKANKKRHPTVEDQVIIYSGATILGGETIIGKGSVIGGNVWITQSVPSYSLVFHKSEIYIKDKYPISNSPNFII